MCIRDRLNRTKRVTKIETKNITIPGKPNLYGLSKNRSPCVRVKKRSIKKTGQSVVVGLFPRKCLIKKYDAVI